MAAGVCDYLNVRSFRMKVAPAERLIKSSTVREFLLMRPLRLIAMSVWLFAASLSSGFGDPYKVGAGDKLRVSVYQWTALDNTYTIDPSGAISLPIVGTIAVEGFDTEKISSTIAHLLATKMKLVDQPTASVEIVQFRPFSVLGDVAKPGQYSYRPGMIVLDALAMAGGYYRPGENSAYQMDKDLSDNQQKLATTEASLRRFETEQLRLQAAAAGTNLQDLRALRPSDEMDPDGDLIKRQATILTTQQLDLADHIKSFDSETATLVEEVVRRESQISAIKEELEGLSEEAANVHNLVKKGMSTTSRETGLEVTIADVKRTQFEIESTIVRSRQDIKNNTQKKNTLLSDFRVKSLLDLSEVDAKVESARIEVTALQAAIEREAPLSGNTVSIAIVNRSRSGKSRRKVDELDAVNPEDIVIFTRDSTETKTKRTDLPTDSLR